MSSTIRKGGFQGSGDPGPPTNLMRPQVKRVNTTSLQRLRELEGDRVPYEYRGLPVLVPRCAHNEIERLKAENADLREQRNRTLGR